MRAERCMECMEVWGGNEAADMQVSMPGLDAWVYSRPFEGQSAGGDVHYLSSCATGRITRLLVADIAGHGAQVDMPARRLRDLMRQYVNYRRQTRFVSRMNEAFGVPDSAGVFATAVIATYWAPTARLTVSNAGHPRPMIHRDGSWELLGAVRPSDRDNLPFGIQGQATYDAFSLTLRPDQTVMFYSDSLIDARGPGQRPIGEGGLRDLLNTIGAASPDAVLAQLPAAMNERGLTGVWADDVTMLLVRRNAQPMRMKPADLAIAAWRVTQDAARSLMHRRPTGARECGCAPAAHAEHR